MSNMKMAKASADDIKQMIEFFQSIEEWMEHGTYTVNPGEDNEKVHHWDDELFVDHLREKWGGRWRPAGVDCAWTRVVMGYQVLIDNCCDPDADTLEWRPDILDVLAKEDDAPADHDQEHLCELCGVIPVHHAGDVCDDCNARDEQ